MAKVGFYRCSQSDYYSISSIDSNGLYFLEDSKQLYLGSVEITESLVFVDNWSSVTSPVVGKFYLNTITGEFKCCDKNGLRTLVPPVAASSDDFSDPDKRNYFASISVIKDFVEAKIGQSTAGVSSVEYDTTTGSIDVVKDGETLHNPLTGVAHEPTYENLILTIPVYGGEDIVVDLPKDNFVRSGRYEPDYPLPDPPGGHGPAIVLVVGDGEYAREIVIPADVLFQAYTGGSTDTVDVRINDQTHAITASVKLSEAANNIIKANDDGLFADYGDFAPKNADLSLGEVVLSDGEGGFSRSNVYISRQELKSDYLATGDVISRAITAAISGATNELNARLTAVEDRLPHIEENQIIVGRNDKYASSGVTIGGPVLNNPSTETVVATELAVRNAIQAAMVEWNYVDPYPGYHQVMFTSATQSDVQSVEVANEYPPSNAVDGNITTTFFPACHSNVGSRLELDLNTEIPEYRPYILEITWAAGPGGVEATADVRADVMAYVRGVGTSAHRVPLPGNLTQQEICNMCIEEGGQYKMVAYMANTEGGRIYNLRLECYRNSFAPDRWLGLGVSEIKLYVKDN